MALHAYDKSMAGTSYLSVHDAYLLGVMLQGDGSAVVALRSPDGTRASVFLDGVLQLRLSNFLRGNILLDASISPPTDFSVGDARRLLGDDCPRSQYEALVATAAERGLVFVEFNPSYGAELLVLCSAVRAEEFS